MRYFSTFSGVEGMGQKITGGEPVGFSEIDQNASMVLKYRFPNIKNYGDITKIKWSEVPDFDLLTGGSPCQDFSIAGKRGGLGGAKSSLAWEYIRCLRDKQPRYFIWENVKGVMSSRGGWDFANLLVAFSESGYSLWWQVLNAKDFGVPQNRERIFIVGSRTGSPLEILFVPQSDRGDGETAGQTEPIGKSLTTRAERYDPYTQDLIANTITTGQYPPSRTQRREKESYVATTINTRGGTRGGWKIPTSRYYGIRRFTPLESERIMGWPDNWTKYGTNEKGETVEISDGQRYKMCGNGVVPICVEYITSFLLDQDSSSNTPTP